jgi:hypothetical protein
VPSIAAETGPGIGDVVAEVRSLVDARDDEAGAPAEDPVHGEVHAVGRRPVDRVARVPELLDAERPVERQRMADGAPLPVGRDDDHLAHRRERRRERRDPLGMDAVIVRDEDERR